MPSIVTTWAASHAVVGSGGSHEESLFARLHPASAESRLQQKVGGGGSTHHSAESSSSFSFASPFVSPGGSKTPPVRRPPAWPGHRDGDGLATALLGGRLSVDLESDAALINSHRRTVADIAASGGGSTPEQALRERRKRIDQMLSETLGREMAAAASTEDNNNTITKDEQKQPKTKKTPKKTPSTANASNDQQQHQPEKMKQTPSTTGGNQQQHLKKSSSTEIKNNKNHQQQLVATKQAPSTTTNTSKTVAANLRRLTDVSGCCDPGKTTKHVVDPQKAFEAAFTKEKIYKHLLDTAEDFHSNPISRYRFTNGFFAQK
jgi:hypothetical protein